MSNVGKKDYMNKGGYILLLNPKQVGGRKKEDLLKKLDLEEKLED